MVHRDLKLTAALVLALGAAVFLRTGAFDLRPLHGDEGLNTFKFAQLLQGEGYRYDPSEYHGPVLPYATLLAAKISGATDYASTNETMYRSVTVVFGLFIVAVTALGFGLRGPMGWAGVVAGLLCAVSTPMVFYSRYYIHETPLVLFTAGAMACGWRYASTGKIKWAIACGVALALMGATKETCLIAWSAMLCALIGVKIWNKLLGDHEQKCACKYRGILWGVLGFAVVWIVLFTSFFTNPQGLIDSVKAYGLYLERGTGGEPLHLHEWSWYLKRLLWFKPLPNGPWWSEAFIVGLALVGGIASMRKGGIGGEKWRSVGRFLTVYTLAMVVAYAIIPYKTPWSMLGMLHGMIWLAGLGAVTVWGILSGKIARTVWVLLLAVGAWQLASQAWAGSFKWHTHRVNPYVYAHPGLTVKEIGERIESLATKHADGKSMGVGVIDGRNIWPIPFYLREMNRVGYFAETPTPAQWAKLGGDEKMGVVLVDPYREDLASLLGDRFEGPHFYGLRPDTVVGMYIEKTLWAAWMQDR